VRRACLPGNARDRVRYLLMLAGCSQNSGARALDINMRTMRRYCLGEPMPRVVDYALLGLVAVKHGMKV
jgi:hypothetical protein